MDASLRVADRSAADPRIARSEAAISDALLGLLTEGRAFESLTVSEVADGAGVTRKTFYARFGSLERVVFRLVEGILDRIVDDLEDELLRMPRTDRVVSRRVFDALRAEGSVLAPLVSRCPSGLFLAPVSAVADRLLDRVLAVNAAPPLTGPRRDYLIAVIASVLHGMLTVWVRRAFSEPPEEVAALLDTLLGQGVETFLLAAFEAD